MIYNKYDILNQPDMKIDNELLDTLTLFVILDDGDDLRVSEDVTYWNNRKYKYDKIILNIAVTETRNIQTDVTHFVHENSVIYIPVWMHHEFYGISEVSISLINPRIVPNIGTIIIKPLSKDFHRKYNNDTLMRLFSNANILMKYPPIHSSHTGFEIVELVSDKHGNIDYGSTCNQKFRIEVQEIENQQRVWLQSSVVDFSPVKTEVYQKKYIRNGDIVYVK